MMRLAIALAACLWTSLAFAQSYPLKFDGSNGGTNSTLVLGGAAQLKSITLCNASGVLSYFKLYDTVTAPLCNTAAVVFKAPVPFGAGQSGSCMVGMLADGLQFKNGIGFCLTGGAADSDNSNAGTGVTINLGVKQ